MHELEGGVSDTRNDQPVFSSNAEIYRRQAVDGNYRGPVRQDNTSLSNSELTSRIEERIAQGKPIGRLLSEYESRT